jgi:hypothetical protein
VTARALCLAALAACTSQPAPCGGPASPTGLVSATITRVGGDPAMPPPGSTCVPENDAFVYTHDDHVLEATTCSSATTGGPLMILMKTVTLSPGDSAALENAIDAFGPVAPNCAGNVHDSIAVTRTTGTTTVDYADGCAQNSDPVFAVIDTALQ